MWATRWLFRQRNVGRLTQDIAFRCLQALGDRIEANDLGLSQRGLTTGAIAVDPRDVMNFLPGSFHELPQEVMFVIG